MRVILESQVTPGKSDAIMPFLEENLPNVRGFKGCRRVDVLFNAETGVMIFDEDWQSIEDHQAYIDFISRNGVMEQLASYLEQPPKVTYLTALPL